MQILGHFIVRLVVIMAGFAAAVIAASLFLSLGLAGGFFEAFFEELNVFFEGELQDTGPIVHFLILVFGLFSSVSVATVALLPASIGIAIAELMRWQGLTVNLVLGGLIGLAAGSWGFMSANTGLPSEGTVIVLLAGGFTGGFFYWLIAGRSAGKWMGEIEREVS